MGCLFRIPYCMGFLGLLKQGLTSWGTENNRALILCQFRGTTSKTKVSAGLCSLQNLQERVLPRFFGAATTLGVLGL